jgi:hypothetical protein
MWGSPHGQYETGAAFVTVTSSGLARFVTAVIIFDFVLRPGGALFVVQKGGDYPSFFLFWIVIRTQPKYFRCFRKPSRLSP